MTRLCVGNLADEVTEEELRDAFHVFGQVRAVEIARDPSGEGAAVGHVAMMWQAHALAAIQALDGTHMRGRSITVARALAPAHGEGGSQDGWDAAGRTAARRS